MRAPGAPPADADSDALWPEPPPPAGDPRGANFTRSGVGGAQGRCLSTQWTVAPFNECLHRVQKHSPTTVFCGQADDYAMNDTVDQVLKLGARIDKMEGDIGGQHRGLEKHHMTSMIMQSALRSRSPAGCAEASRPAWPLAPLTTAAETARRVRRGFKYSVYL